MAKKISMDEYMELSNNTENTEYEVIGDRMSSLGYSMLQTSMYNQFINMGRTLDALKKHSIYGVSIGEVDNVDKVETVVPLTDEQRERMSSELYVRLNHGILGLVTEAAELVEALQHHVMTGEPIDLVNVGEEVADGLWYDALILRSLGVTFEDVAYTNIEKLKARFPNKFTEKDAQVRNLDAERAILEQENIKTSAEDEYTDEEFENLPDLPETD